MQETYVKLNGEPNYTRTSPPIRKFNLTDNKHILSTYNDLSYGSCVTFEEE